MRDHAARAGRVGYALTRAAVSCCLRGLRAPAGRPWRRGWRKPALWLCGFAFVAACCQKATRPTALPPGPDLLVIAPPIEALKMGERETLSALLIRGDGSRTAVRASWASDAPQVVSVTADGEARGVGLGRATIRAVFETLTATRPLRVVPDFEGTWSGEYRVAGCTRLSGRGSDYWRFVLGSSVPVRLLASQKAANVTGSLEFYSNLRALVEAGPVQGVVGDDGALQLSGTTNNVDPVHPSETVLEEWRTSLTQDRAGMVGRFVRNRTFVNAFGPQRVIQERSARSSGWNALRGRSPGVFASGVAGRVCSRRQPREQPAGVGSKNVAEGAPPRARTEFRATRCPGEHNGGP